MDSTILTLKHVQSWLALMGYPSPSKQSGAVALLLEGCVPVFSQTNGGKLYAARRKENLGDLWEAQTSSDSIVLQDSANICDRADDTLILLWWSKGAVHMGVCIGSCDAGTKLSRKSGWPKIGDGVHWFGRSTYTGGKACLRAASGKNRVLRELPDGAAGGDGVVTLAEVIERGMVYNRSILIHPMWSGPEKASAGCCGPTGGPDNVPWRALYGHSSRGCTIIVHDGGDLIRYIDMLSVGTAADYRPYVRAGCNAAKWVKPLQRALGISQDGEFGPGTAAALLDNRKQRGLTGDELQDRGFRPADWSALGMLGAAFVDQNPKTLRAQWEGRTVGEILAVADPIALLRRIMS